jgi:regulator of protease activity HflC (stomatin/prohibitin superfamily)
VTGAARKGSPYAALANARRLLEDAARTYAEATERGEGRLLEGMQAAARLRLAAKDFVAAERRVKEIPG